MNNNSLPTNKILLALFLLALGLRLLVGWQTLVVPRDSVFYLDLAYRFQQGDYGSLLASAKPLYPMIVGGLGDLINDLESAGKLVSAFFGALVVFPLFFVARRLFDEKTAYLTTLLYTFHPKLLQLSGEALTETSYIFFLTATAWQALEAISGERKTNFLLAGLLLPGFFLTRFEGGVVAMLIGLWTIAYLGYKERRPALYWLQRLVILALPSLVLIIPYILYFSYLTGDWIPFSGVSVPLLNPTTYHLDRVIPGMIFMLRSAGEMLNVFFWGFLVFGLIRGREKQTGWSDIFIISIVASYLTLIYLGYLSRGRDLVSKRYLLHYLSLLLPWAGYGLGKALQTVALYNPDWPRQPGSKRASPGQAVLGGTGRVDKGTAAGQAVGHVQRLPGRLLRWRSEHRPSPAGKRRATGILKSGERAPDRLHCNSKPGH
jgi:asparagine N-glycosylation enzyme membrane subunit Stt3